MSVTSEVSLWLCNTESDYRAITAMAIDCLRIACDNESHARTARNDAVEALAQDIETYVCAAMPCRDGMWGSIINSAISSIDFEKIATSFLEDEEIWSVFSSDAEEAELFLSKEEARDCLEAKLDDDDNTLHAGLFLAVGKLDDGGSVDIDGVTYHLVRQ